MGEEKRDRGFKTIYCGSQVPQYSAFFGFDFAGGGLGYFDMKVIRGSRSRSRGSERVRDVSRISALGQGIKRFSRPWINQLVRAVGIDKELIFLMHCKSLAKKQL